LDHKLEKRITAKINCRFRREKPLKNQRRNSIQRSTNENVYELSQTCTATGRDCREVTKGRGRRDDIKGTNLGKLLRISLHSPSEAMHPL
tara:strand:+ start:458 stop:727 length:270 start_codon:yes stop_codon:yes gene_type:complete